MLKKLYLIGTIVFVLLATSCKEQKVEIKEVSAKRELPTYPSSKLPDNIKWQTNNSDEVFSSPDAKKGGTLRLYIPTFPLSLRTVGPDTNNSFRSALLGNQLSLTSFHPNTDNVIPEMATHWAYAKDRKTIYYKLDKAARWSDGTQVTADDYLFTIDFMRSKHIFAPWHNNHYTNMIDKVIKFDDFTIAVVGKIAKPKKDLHYSYNLTPRSRSFHELKPTWVQDTNWKIEPNTGPYQISKIKRGKLVEFSRKTDWWAKDRYYFKNRFNVDKVRFKVIRDQELAFKHFLKGNIDVFNLNLPEYWHKKTNTTSFNNGYINKYWFYNDAPRFAAGIYLNTASPILKSVKVRRALSHAINMQKVLELVLLGDYERLQTMHTGYGKYTNKNIKARKFDINLANKLLEEDGWNKKNSQGIRTKNGELLKIKLTYWKDHDSNQLVILREEAKKAGIDLQLHLLEPSSGYKHTMEKKHQAVWLAWSTGFRPVYWQHFHSSNANKSQTNNITNTEDLHLDKLIMQYRKSTYEKDRIVLARKIEQVIHNNVVYIPASYAPYTRSAAWRWIKLPKFISHKESNNIFSPFLSNGSFWIDTQTKEETTEMQKKHTKLPVKTIINEKFRNK